MRQAVLTPKRTARDQPVGWTSSTRLQVVRMVRIPLKTLLLLSAGAKVDQAHQAKLKSAVPIGAPSADPPRCGPFRGSAQGRVRAGAGVGPGKQVRLHLVITGLFMPRGASPHPSLRDPRRSPRELCPHRPQVLLLAGHPHRFYPLSDLMASSIRSLPRSFSKRA